MTEKIRVITDELRKSQKDWEMLLKGIERNFIQIGEGLCHLEQCFAGETVSDIRERGKKHQQEGIAALSRLKAHIEKLEEIGRIYEQTERRNVEDAADN